MKKLLCIALSCLLIFALLAGCGGGNKTQDKPFDPAAATQAVLDSGAFSETLEQLDTMVLLRLLGLDSLDADGAAFDGSVAYYSTGATSELAAVLQIGEGVSAEEAAATLDTWLDNQLEAVRDYQPAEVEKLEHAILETRRNTILLVVADDWDAAQEAVDNL